ncbi:hypothetical protein TCAL_08939 [Tigriopus californicus]|uniref:Uncharacterized protein n=1 Tax=Tigriopus californicus TaxID=6832 RepID=A0A553PQR3_TIGCA|nr:uncharacterized protein LOC131882329 [Tigriopus californicus]TRY80005.1 hypothetical protein TCAL_08939 [Tigriopus californicus]|eukprot:TCALIF_08939-PA protein Name:"Protein of unknown function" AED:0.41 eAED:0.41 QI:138/1/0.66/1/0/0.66/3/0/970
MRTRFSALPRASLGLGLLLCFGGGARGIQVTDTPNQPKDDPGFIPDFFKRFPTLPFSERTVRSTQAGNRLGPSESSKSFNEAMSNFASSSYPEPTPAIRPSPRTEVTAPMSPSNNQGNTYQSPPKMVRITQPMVFLPRYPHESNSEPKMIHRQSLKTNDVSTGFVISSPFKGTKFGDERDQFNPFMRHERSRSTTTAATTATITTTIPVYIRSTTSSGYVEPQESRNLPSGTPLYREALNGRETYGSPTPLITVHDLKTADPYSAQEQEHKNFLDQAENDIISGKGRPHLEFPPSPTKEPQYVPNYFKDLPDYSEEDEENDEFDEGHNEEGRFRSEQDYDQGPKDAFGDFKFADTRPTQEQPQELGDFTQFGPTQSEDEGDIGPLNFHAVTEKPFGVGEPDFMDYDDKDVQNQKNPGGTQPSSHANHLFGDVFPDFSDEGPLGHSAGSGSGNGDYGEDYHGYNGGNNQYDGDYQGSFNPTSPPHPTSIAAILKSQNQVPPFPPSIIQGAPGTGLGLNGVTHLGPRQHGHQGKERPEGPNGAEYEDSDPNSGFDDGDYYEKAHDEAAQDYEDNFDYDTPPSVPEIKQGFNQGRHPGPGQFRDFQRVRRRRPFHHYQFRNQPSGPIPRFNQQQIGNKFRSRPLFDVTQLGFGNIRPNPAYPDPLPISLPVEQLPQAIREQLNSGPGSHRHPSPPGIGLNNDYANGEDPENTDNENFHGNEADLSNDLSLYGPQFDESLLDDPKLYNKPNSYQAQEGLSPQFRGLPNHSPPRHPGSRIKGRLAGHKLRRPIVLRQAQIRLRQKQRGPHLIRNRRPRPPTGNVPNYDYHEEQVEEQVGFNDEYSDYTDGPELRELANLGPSANEFDLSETGFADLSEFEDEESADRPRQPAPSPQAREVPQFPVPDRPNLLTHWIAGTPTHILIKEGNEHKLKKIKWKKHPLPVLRHGPPQYVPSEALRRGIKIAPRQIQPQVQ